jgi:hypothetical protein
MFRFFYSQGNSHGLLASHHQFSQGDMVYISQKSSLDDEDSTVIEGVVIDQVRRFLTFAPSFLFPVPFKQLSHMNFSVTYAS